MSKTLVIILAETRAHELTFDNFKQNAIDTLNADLCLCIGVKPDYDYENPFFKLAKYKFLYNETDDYGDAFDYACNIISKYRPKYEILKNIIINDENNQEKLNNEDNNYDIYLKSNTNKKRDYIYKMPLPWRKFLEIKDQFLGGIKDIYNQHDGSAGILIFVRWFLFKNIIENGIIYNYDRFVITRSDYIYQLPHPKIELMDEKYIWIPDSQYYGGYTDRHAILSKHNIKVYLNILNNMILRSNEYFFKMQQDINGWNLEKLIKFHFEQNNVLHLVKEFPYIMYTVRNINGTTRWSAGVYSEIHGYYIKYDTEYKKSSDYKNEYDNSGLSIDDFYMKYIL